MKIWPVCLLIISACGKNIENHKTTSQFINQETQGIYEATLKPLNHHKFYRQGSFNIHGKASFSLESDDFKVKLNAYHLPYGYHSQSLYIGSICPTGKDDLNQDGFIDEKEGEKVWGKQLLPLDRNINNQIQGKKFRKLSDRFGRYHYTQQGLLSRILTALHTKSEWKDSVYAKLGMHENLNLEGRVIVLHGVDSKYIVPKSVQSIGNYFGQTTLPIACGVVKAKKARGP